MRTTAHDYIFGALEWSHTKTDEFASKESLLSQRVELIHPKDLEQGASFGELNP